MCGIIGGNYKKWNYGKAVESIRHRGPDAQRIEYLPLFTMGFARLSIIDLSENGMQPMCDESRSVWITFNGEIYGFQRLRRSLERKGYHFRSTSDTEVILYAYMEYGNSFIHRIDGIFAIAILDLRQQQLKLFRDRAGVKPLYYFMQGEYFAYASELKAITAMCDNISFQTDNTAIYDYLTYTYIPEPKTMYHNVYKLPAACMLIYNLKEKKIIKKARYFEIVPNQTYGRRRKPEEITDDLRELIREAVKEQMVADVPVGTFLSGGVDSSIITCEAHEINPQIETFSIGFSDPKYNELEYVELLTGAFQIKQNVKIMEATAFRSMYDRLKDWYDEPYADTSAYPTYLVSSLAREKVTVVLTGDGGDELFGGYGRYARIEKQMKDMRWNSRILSDLYEELCFILQNCSIGLYESLASRQQFLDLAALVVKACGYQGKADKKALAKALGIKSGYDDYWFFRKYLKNDLPPITRLQYLDFHTYLPCDILTKVDRASMQVSLEARVPLLSKKIIRYAFSLSEEERCPGGELKGCFKQAYKNLIPDDILYREKKGFAIPKYFISRHIPVAEELLNSVWKIDAGRMKQCI